MHLLCSRPAGPGSILCVVTAEGSLALLDVSQPLAVRPGFTARQERLREVLSTHSTPAALTHTRGTHTTAAAAAAGAGGGGVGGAVCVPVVLCGPGPLGSSMLLRQPWVLLLRFLLQVGAAGGWGGGLGL